MVSESDSETADELDYFVNLILSQPPLEQARDVFRRQPERITPEFMRHLGRLSDHYLQNGRSEEGGSVARIGLEAAEQVRDPDMIASFIALGNLSLLSIGRVDEAVELV